MSAKAWASLSLYESTELLKHFTEQRTGRSLKDSKARETAAHFSQGREYFRSAATAGELVRPLIVYYGAMSLARGAALFLANDKTKLRSQHGLTGSLGVDLLTTPQALMDCSVTVDGGGTFPELAAAAGNRERVSVVHTGVPRMLTARSPAKSPPAGAVLTVKEILGQIPDLAGLYQRTFGEHSRRLRCEIQTTHELEPGTRRVGEEVPLDREVRRQANVGIIPGSLGLPDPAWVAENVCCGRLEPRGETLLPFARDPANEVARAGLFNLYYDAGSKQSPRLDMPLAVAATGEEYLKLSTKGGITLSTLLALHLAAYVSGMLVRYQPGYWMTLVGRTEGDAFVPILTAAVSAVEERYPALILEAIS